MNCRSQFFTEISYFGCFFLHALSFIQLFVVSFSCTFPHCLYFLSYYLMITFFCKENCVHYSAAVFIIFVGYFSHILGSNFRRLMILLLLLLLLGGIQYFIFSDYFEILFYIIFASSAHSAYNRVIFRYIVH